MPLDPYAALVAGVVCAGIGGELFVRGVVRLAHWARVPPGIIGATVAAFATSSPELAVSISSAMAGKPQIALGDALGSNVVNIALVLALALLVSRVQCSLHSVRRDFPIALMAPVISGLLFLDGVLSRIDGLVLLSVFLAWLVAALIEARKQRSAVDAEPGTRRHDSWFTVFLCIAGLAFLVAAGHLVVTGAKGVAASFGVGEFMVGATIVAVGTSLPELATTVIAKLRGHDEVALGTILGSNIYNGLFIIAIVAIIVPIRIDWREVAVALLFGLVAVMLTYPVRDCFLERRRGAWLLILYGVYLTAVVLPEAS